jgi:DNA replication protein DnaC
MTTLADSLTALGLRHAAAHLEDLVATSTKKRLGPLETIEMLVEREGQHRATKSLERRLARSRIGRFKPIADFEWDWPKRVDRDAVEAALRLEFLDGGRNIILVAPQGLGKTMLARNIANQAVRAGHSVLFVTAAELLLDLAAQDSARSLERRFRHYCRPTLLCIDEIGYLSYDARNADLLFQIVSRRYEHKSIVMTTNLAFSDWPTIFPNATCATALIDRTVHHADVIAIEGDSYRRRQAETDKKARRAKKAS